MNEYLGKVPKLSIIAMSMRALVSILQLLECLINGNRAGSMFRMTVFTKDVIIFMMILAQVRWYKRRKHFRSLASEKSE